MTEQKATQPYTQRRHLVKDISYSDRTACGIPVLELVLQCKTIRPENVTCEECKKIMELYPVSWKEEKKVKR